MEYIATVVAEGHQQRWRGSAHLGSSLLEADAASGTHVLHWTGAAGPPMALRRGDALTDSVLQLIAAARYRVLVVHSTDAAAAFRIFAPPLPRDEEDMVPLYTLLTEHAHAIHLEPPPAEAAAGEATVVAWPYLRPAQLRACAAAHAVERQTVHARSGWRLRLPPDACLDLRSGAVVAAPAGDETLPLRCGLLTGARGSGKTAVVLALAALTEAPPLGAIGGFEAAHLFETRATLVVVPHHLVAWWKQELERAVPPAARGAALFVCNPREAQALTVDAVQRAWVVVCSDKFVARRRRVVDWVQKAAASAPLPPAGAARYAAMRRVVRLTTQQAPPRPQLPPGVPLHLFYWARFVADEPVQWPPACAPMIHARWRWALQADLAHAHPSVLKPLLPVLGIAPEAWTPVLAASFEAACSVEVATFPPAAASGLEQRVEWVTMGREEQQRYECAVAAGWNAERLVRLCAGMPNDQVDAKVAPPRLVQDALEHLGNLHVTLQQMLSGVCQEHPSMAPLMQQEVERAAFFERMRATILAAEASAGSSGGGSGADEDEDEEEEDCPICLTERTTVLTLCGHMFCWACMYKAFSGAPRCPCPTCRYTLSAAHVVSLVRGGGAAGISSSGGVTRRVCAKAQQLRVMCAQLATRREQCVVLAQWPALVRGLAAQLVEAGLDARACAGSVRERGAALAAFRAGGLGVLVVQLDECLGLTLRGSAAPPPSVVLFHAVTHQQHALIGAAAAATGAGVLHRLVVQATVEAAS